MKKNSHGFYFQPSSSTRQSDSGFTLLEVVVVAAIIATLSGILFFNFRSSSTNKTARNQVVSIIISDIRRAQTMTTSSTQFGGSVVCGFGIHYLNATSYLIYAGSDQGGSCATANKNYQNGVDTVVQTISLINQGFAMKSSFLDIFFEPPDPKTYINGTADLGATPTVISIGVVGQSCGGSACTDITVKTSGGIDVNDN